jgi:hypothetical protein
VSRAESAPRMLSHQASAGNVTAVQRRRTGSVATWTGSRGEKITQHSGRPIDERTRKVVNFKGVALVLRKIGCDRQSRNPEAQMTESA